MKTTLDLLEETISHFAEGAKSVRAYNSEDALIITLHEQGGYVITREEPGFPKEKAESLEPYFKDVFGIEARY